MSTRAHQTITNLHNRLVAFRFREIESFIDHSRRGMRGAWAKFSKRFVATTAGWSKDKLEDYVDHIYDDLASLRDESPRLLRHAQCTIIYGSFESAIGGLCRALHRDGRILNTPPKKIYMDDAKGYMRPHFRARPAPFAYDWQWMHELRIIRNWIAHNGGKAQKDKKLDGNWAQAQRFVRRNRGMIRFDGVGEIIVEDALVDRALSKAESSYNRLRLAAQRL